VQVTYHRRPVIGADDIAAMLPVQLGSGVNLYGYYMFHGGTNPPGVLTTLQESQRTGYPTDVPVKSYDFQAPLGEFGEERESYRRIKLVHYFLDAFGDRLAPMVVRRPEVVPSDPADTTVSRLSARTLGERGFIFFNNYLRDYALPVRRAVQVELRLPGDTLRIPSTPVDVPSGAYFIWPVNLEMDGVTLSWATAQLVTLVSDDLGPVYVFSATPGIPPEMVFDDRGNTIRWLHARAGAKTEHEEGRVYVRGMRTSLQSAVTIYKRAGGTVRILLLDAYAARNVWVARVAGRERLMISRQDVFVSGDTIHLRSRDPTPTFSLRVFPGFSHTPRAGIHPLGVAREELFTDYLAEAPPRPVRVTVRKTADAAPVPPVPTYNAVTWRKVEIALAPSDSAWDHAARWRIDLPRNALAHKADLFLDIHYTGDVARLYAGDELLDDNFFNGTTWRVGLRRYADRLRRGPLELRVLPLRSDAPVFIPAAYRPRTFPPSGQVAEVRSVDAVPEYELLIIPRPERR
jgi:hypothetical protein